MTKTKTTKKKKEKTMNKTLTNTGTATRTLIYGMLAILILMSYTSKQSLEDVLESLDDSQNLINKIHKPNLKSAKN